MYLHWKKNLLLNWAKCLLVVSRCRHCLLYNSNFLSLVGIWGFKFALECLLPVAEATMASNPPTYRSILELDEKIRSFDVPISSVPGQDAAKPSSSMQRFVREHYRELSMSPTVLLVSLFANVGLQLCYTSIEDFLLKL